MEMLTPTDDNAFAAEVADFFRRKGDPFYGVDLRLSPPFPLVLLWDNNALMTQVIACTVNEAELENATAFAEEQAVFEEECGNAPCGVNGYGVSPTRWRKHE